jgi:hypothetical protein
MNDMSYDDFERRLAQLENRMRVNAQDASDNYVNAVTLQTLAENLDTVVDRIVADTLIVLNSEIELRSPLEGACAYKWIINHNKVKLIRDGDSLKYVLTIYGNPKRKIQGDVPQDLRYTQENNIFILTQNDPIIMDDGVDFPDVWDEKASDNFKFKLLSINQGELVWQLYDKRTEETKLIPWNFVQLLPSDRCHIESSRIVTTIKTKNFAEQFEIIKDFTAYGIDSDLNQEITYQQPFVIHIEPKSFPSQVDSRLRVSKFTWSVTLVAHNGSDGNHAEIIIEGVNDGFIQEIQPYRNEPKIGNYFLWKAHFRPSISSTITEIFTCEERSQVWMKTSSKVKEMLRNIEASRIRQAEIYAEAPGSDFFLLGKPSLGSGGRHNCFTWAREKLMMLDIHIQYDAGVYFAALVKRYTKVPDAYKDTKVIVWI